jgi:hypothetical protein
MTSMSMKTMCSFCYGKVLEDPDFPLVQGQTCGTVMAGAAMMYATNPNCELAKQAEPFCCPVKDDPAAPPDTTMGAPSTTEVIFAPAPTPPEFTPPPTNTLGAPSG